jgi:hypothetical protein
MQLGVVAKLVREDRLQRRVRQPERAGREAHEVARGGGCVDGARVLGHQDEAAAVHAGVLTRAREERLDAGALRGARRPHAEQCTGGEALDRRRTMRTRRPR